MVSVGVWWDGGAIGGGVGVGVVEAVGLSGGWVAFWGLVGVIGSGGSSCGVEDVRVGRDRASSYDGSFVVLGGVSW